MPWITRAVDSDGAQTPVGVDRAIGPATSRGSHSHFTNRLDLTWACLSWDNALARPGLGARLPTEVPTQIGGHTEMV